MRALVTGGGGFLGRYIVEKLIARGDHVRVLSRRAYPDLVKLGCECVQGDLRDREIVVDACRNRDVVFHVAALAGIWGKRQDFFSINVDGTRNVIDACRASSVPKLIYTSTPSVVFAMNDLEGVDETQPYPARFFGFYAESKAVAEKMVLNSDGQDGLSTCALRPHLIWGPRDNHIIPMLIQRAKSRRLVQIGEGRNLVDICYVENAADAHLSAADALAAHSCLSGQVYFLGDGNPVNLWEWIKSLLFVLELPTVDVQISYRNAYRIGTFMECLYTLLPFLGEPRLTRFMAAQFALSHYFDHSKARNDFGYNPRVSNKEGLRRTVAWFDGC